MNRKLLPVIAAFLILAILLGTTPFTYALTRATIGPKLEVTTIPEDDQKRETGVIIIGIDPTAATLKTRRSYDYLSQHKLLVTYNGMTLQWALGSVGVTVVCNVIEKDKVNVMKDPKTGTGKQGDWENLMTSLKDVSDKFVCKPRWKSPSPGVLESAGILDIYYVGPYPKADIVNQYGQIVTAGVSGAEAGVWIADYIVVVEAILTIGRTVVYGSEIQDICVLGWAVSNNDAATSVGGVIGAVGVFNPPTFWYITKPDGTRHYFWANALGNFVSCEELALAQRDILHIGLATAQDSQA